VSLPRQASPLLLTSCFLFFITCKTWINSHLVSGGICQQWGKLGWTFSPAYTAGLGPAHLKKWRNRWAFSRPNSTKLG
jgi:hypothetical protein